METLDPRWRKSSYSGNGGDCVEVADHDNHLMVRDSKNPESGKLAFTTASWKAYTARVKASLAHPLPTCKGHSRVLRCPLRRVRGRFLVAGATQCARRAACQCGSRCAFHGYSSGLPFVPGCSLVIAVVVVACWAWLLAGRGLLVHRAFIIAPIRCSALALAWM
jgi:hypothetical protein